METRDKNVTIVQWCDTMKTLLCRKRPYAETLCVTRGENWLSNTEEAKKEQELPSPLTSLFRKGLMTTWREEVKEVVGFLGQGHQLVKRSVESSTCLRALSMCVYTHAVLKREITIG